MKRQEGLILVGGAKRNIGKTTLVCKIIENFAQNNSIIGLKLKTIYDGDQYFHGKDEKTKFSDYLLIEESDKTSIEDTGKMLRAGAQRAFLLRSKSECLLDAYLYFMSLLSDSDLIVCESNSLRKLLEPDLYLFIKDKNNNVMKPSAIELEKFANQLIYTNGTEHDFDFRKLQILNSRWILDGE